MRTSRLGPRLGLTLFVLWLGSCSTSPKPEDEADPPNPVLGTYQASSLTVVLPGQTIDVLASGGSLTIALAANGTTSGRLFVVGGADNGQDLDANMAGTWTQTGTAIRFGQNTDTFVRDATWTIATSTLRTTFITGTTTVTAVLTKQ